MLLSPGYAEADHARMAELAAKSNDGVVTPAERREIESYALVDDVLSMLKAKARLSLRKHSPAARGAAVTKAIRRFVYGRAAGRREHCHLPQAGREERVSGDHIVA